jgi:hypothetical protein
LKAKQHRYSDRLTATRAGLVVAALLLINLSAARAEQPSEGDSPSRHLHFVVKGPQDDKRIYLSIEGHPQEEVELCQTPGWGNLQVYFSPDDSWVVVQDGGGSLGVSLRLFRREKGAAYKEMTERDVGRAAELAAMKLNHFPEKELLDHRYVKLLSWSVDSKTFLFSMSGHGGDGATHIRITEWTGIYDLANGTIGFDLNQMNQGVFQAEKGR